MSIDFKIDGFEIEREIDEGSFAQVYLAYDKNVSRKVVIKIPKEVSHDSMERFISEAQMAAKLEDNGIVRLYQFGLIQEPTSVYNQKPFAVMQYIDGGSLADLVGLDRQQLPCAQIAALMIKICRAVAFAHEYEIIHRDLKPKNILLNSHGNPFVADFGLAVLKEDGCCEVAGTREYIAPEQILGRPKKASDIWSLGIILYELLTGKVPFPSNDDQVGNILSANYEPPRQVDSSIPEGLEDICKKCLSKNPAKRFTTALDIANALKRFADPLVVWNLPYDPNPFFTGRREILKEVYDVLKEERKAAITGLGGIGKTQTAIQYAHEHRDEYKVILWANAESQQTLVSDFVSFVDYLNLSLRSDDEQQIILDAIFNWLRRNDNWLLILDNVEDLNSVINFIPSGMKGHVILTARNPSTGNFSGTSLERMAPEQGAKFLLRRAKIITSGEELSNASDEHIDIAIQLSEELGGLPLALDQAGAFIEETQSTLDEYLTLYKDHGTQLRTRRGDLTENYPESVATTWDISFEKIENNNPAAADMLRFCSFLAADDIPEELFTNDGGHLGPRLNTLSKNPLAFTESIKELNLFSLIKRNPEQKTLSIHRLVQEVQKDRINDSEQSVWAKRVVYTIAEVFQYEEYEHNILLKRILPHAIKAANLLDEYQIEFPKAAFFLLNVSQYLSDTMQYTAAESLLRKSLEIDKASLGPDHPDVAISLNNLGALLNETNRYSKAEQLYRRALKIKESHFPLDHPEIAISLNNLASLLDKINRHGEAEELYRRALEIREISLGTDHPDVASTLSNLGLLLTNTNRHNEAEGLYRRALKIREASVGPDHPDVASSLNNLASLLDDTNRHREAESLCRRALKIREASVGPDHLDTAVTLNNLGSMLAKTGCHNEVEPLFQRALKITETAFGPDHPDVARILNNIASFYTDFGRYDEAEPLYRRALEIREASLGPEHPDVASSLNHLASLLDDTNRHNETEPLYRRALEISETSLGPNHPDVALALNNLGSLLKKTNRYSEAEPLYRRALAIYEASFGSNHPEVATLLDNLGLLLSETNQYDDVEQLHRRALEIREASFGPEHLDVSISLNNLAGFFMDLGHYNKAEPLYRRALEIKETSLGPDHPDVASNLNNLAYLLNEIDRHSEAEPLYRRALEIIEASLGPSHPDLAMILNNLGSLLAGTGRHNEAEPLFQRTLIITETAFGSNHPEVTVPLGSLGRLLIETNRHNEAEPLLKRAVEITEASFGPHHPDLATILNALGLLFKETGRYNEAETLYQRALTIIENSFGQNHPDIATNLIDLALLLLKMNRPGDARLLLDQAKTILEKNDLM